MVAPKNKSSKRTLALGDPNLDNQTGTWLERASVISVNPNTLSCEVESESRGRMTCALPGLQQDPAGSGGEVLVPRVGQQVLVLRGLGLPVITQFLPVPVSRAADRSAAFAPVTTAATADTSAAFPAGGPVNFLGQLPIGLAPGDWVRFGNQGQHLSLLEGGVAEIASTPWAGLTTNRIDDTVRLAGRNLRIYTGFGNLSFSDQGGKQSFLLEGGTDQKTETGFGMENWTYLIRAGGEDAEGMLDVVLKDRQGGVLFKHTISPTGAVEQQTRGDHTERTGGNWTGNFEQGWSSLISGDHSTTVGGTQTLSVTGAQEVTVSQSQLVNVMQDSTLTVNRDWGLSVGRSGNVYFGGNALAKPGDAALKWGVDNGSWVVDIGVPGFDLGAAFSGMKVTTWGPQGDIALTSQLSKIILNTTVPESVLLGAISGVAPFHAVLWEPLQAFLQALISWLTAHIHPTSMGPSGTAVVPSPASAQLNPLVNVIKSNKVLIGA